MYIGFCAFSDRWVKSILTSFSSPEWRAHLTCSPVTSLPRMCTLAALKRHCVSGLLVNFLPFSYDDRLGNCVFLRPAFFLISILAVRCTSEQLSHRHLYFAGIEGFLHSMLICCNKKGRRGGDYFQLSSLSCSFWRQSWQFPSPLNEKSKHPCYVAPQALSIAYLDWKAVTTSSDWFASKLLIEVPSLTAYSKFRHSCLSLILSL